ncbi:uncharacterized protein V6R79_000708 [Siganus canaliculatus]
MYEVKGLVCAAAAGFLAAPPFVLLRKTSGGGVGGGGVGGGGFVSRGVFSAAAVRRVSQHPSQPLTLGPAWTPR